MKHDLLIIIPAYNEAYSIEGVLKILQEPPISEWADVLVVNDASKDNTNELVKLRNIKMVTHVFNLGYGSAIRLGYKYAVRRGYEYVIQMDADGQHDPCNIPRLYEELKKKGEDGKYPDIVLGSRFMEGSSEYKMSGVRYFAVRLFRVLVRLFTGRRIMDPTTGLQGLSRRAFLYYSQMGHFDDRYPDADMIIQMLLLKFKVREIPAVMHNRMEGTSMHSGLKPVLYMIHMMTAIIMIVFRHGVWKIDAGVGERDTIWKISDKTSDKI